MQYIGKSKVTKLNVKAGAVYPLIRLPKTYVDKIGEVAEIFETQHQDTRALFVTFRDHTPSKVIQPAPKIIQLDSSDSVENRLSALETEISELNSALLLNESNSFHKNRKNSGPGRIRIGDLRHVKAGDSSISA
ncbi:MAG: hypothetical protein ACXV4C_09350 [Halobacteriota archaeon]